MTDNENNANMDTVETGIVWSRLVSVADEMVSALVRTSFSTMVRESGDFSCMLFDSRGNYLAQGAVSVPSFTGTGPSTLKSILEHIPLDSMCDGDVIITNDPWIGTGHVYDINVVKPVFLDGTLVGFCLTVSHLADVGGAGYGAGSKFVFEEGFSLPPVRLFEKGELNTFVMKFIERNVRFRELVIGDIYSNVASCNVGASGILDILKEYNLPDLRGVADNIFALTRASIEDSLKSIPKGTFTGQIPVEGVEGTPQINLQVKIEITDQGIAFDFEGTDPAVARGVNVPICYTRAFCYFCFKVLVAPSIPNNQAVLDFVQLDAPDNCILNALWPNPTGARHIFGHYVAPLVFGALSKAFPIDVQADSGMIFQVNLRGRNNAGRDFSSIYFAPGGYGAFGDMDGRAALPGPSNMIGGSIEIWEADTGCTFKCKQISPDTGGSGETQGGNGSVFELVNDTNGVIDASFMTSRTSIAARGFEGGMPGHLRTVSVDGELINPKARVDLQPGQSIRVQDAGGGGFGDPKKRSVERIRADLAAKLVTREYVERNYPEQAASVWPLNEHSAAE